MELNWPQPSAFPSLTSGEVHVWAVRLDVGGASEAVAQKLLVGGEIERANKFVLEKPRRNFVTSRAALRSILGGYLGQQPHEVAIVANSNGKPQLSIGELGFNLTHSEDLALIAVTRGCEIGVDVEAVRPIERLADLVRRNFHPAEIAAVDAAIAADAPSVFLLLDAQGSGAQSLGRRLEISARRIRHALAGERRRNHGVGDALLFAGDRSLRRLRCRRRHARTSAGDSGVYLFPLTASMASIVERRWMVN